MGLFKRIFGKKSGALNTQDSDIGSVSDENKKLTLDQLTSVILLNKNWDVREKVITSVLENQRTWKYEDLIWAFVNKTGVEFGKRINLQFRNYKDSSEYKKCRDKIEDPEMWLNNEIFWQYGSMFHEKTKDHFIEKLALSNISLPYIESSFVIEECYFGEIRRGAVSALEEGLKLWPVFNVKHNITEASALIRDKFATPEYLKRAEDAENAIEFIKELKTTLLNGELVYREDISKTFKNYSSTSKKMAIQQLENCRIIRLVPEEKKRRIEPYGWPNSF